MLGDILGELASSVIGDLFSPSTDRGRVRFNLVLSVIAAAVQVLDPYDCPQSVLRATMEIWVDDAWYVPGNRELCLLSGVPGAA